ncbi:MULTISPECIES: flagellar export chaperone FliS [Duganella]|uniref:Flagellar secretion chaperone FliS n=1 Tax=Duganella zoogloeoides TaxID=75659 RepID=A0ABZ0XRL9_9BURK|nr:MULTISPECIES: flagellar export chaperone FliS [Duganella]KQN65842.1 flagellar export chaperone FliS [Duganella sp. Leaf61]MPQ55525.1 flagellar export chaperone FliS [Duganella sp. FT27W]WQH02386.1 flagellar export chaperone FliS [Duganella zoogloeoides]
MLNHEAYSSYHATNLDAQVARASPVELVLVLTDGLLEELARARGHIAGKRYELKAISLNKCTDIINGLSSSLDYDNGGEVVKNLGRLYEYCASRLYTAGINLDPLVIDEVIALLTTIKKGWLGVQAKANGG